MNNTDMNYTNLSHVLDFRIEKSIFMAQVSEQCNLTSIIIAVALAWSTSLKGF